MNPRMLACLTVLLGTSFGASASDQAAHVRIEWAVQSDGPVRSAAVIAGDTLYFGSADGFVYAVAKRAGTLRWKFDVGSPIVSSPAVAGSTVVVNGRGRDVFALDSATGQIKWTFRTRPALPATLEWSYFTAAPVIAGNEVYVPSSDGHLYVLDLASGNARWNFETAGRLYAAPLVTGDVIYLASGDDHVYALSRRDGSVRWKFATAGTGYDLSQGFTRTGIFTQPVLNRGTLVFGSRDANVYALDAATGAKRWTFAYDTTWAMSVATRDDTVFVGWSINDKINALDLRTGKQKWEFDADSHTYTRALVLGDNTYWGTGSGSVYCLAASDGALQWRYNVGSDIYSPLVHDGETFFFGTDDGRLIALARKSQSPRKAVYLPRDIPGNLQGLVLDRSLDSRLASKGYRHLDSAAALAQWMTEQTVSDAPSVVVFGYAQIPIDLVGSDPAHGPLRKYLEAGGKVVWPWGIPNSYVFDDQGKFISHDPSLTENMLDLTFVSFDDSGNYFSRATQAGRNWGMPAWLRTSSSYAAPDSDVSVLATDEFGRISAFVKPFSQRIGSGWVGYGAKGFGVPISAKELDILEHMASYGID